MKKLILVAALAITTVGSTAWGAAVTAVIGVSATVVGTCKVITTGSIAFTLDPSSGSDASGTVANPTFWCTRGTPFTVADDFGIHEASTNVAPRRMQHSTSTTDYIPYALTYSTTAATGQGKSTAITLTLTSGVFNVDFVNALVGSYADTVTVSITP